MSRLDIRFGGGIEARNVNTLEYLQGIRKDLKSRADILMHAEPQGEFDAEILTYIRSLNTDLDRIVAFLEAREPSGV